MKEGIEINYKKLIIPITFIIITSTLSGCIDGMEPYYVFTLHIQVKHGIITNFTIFLPLPIKENKIFYGMEGYLGPNKTYGRDQQIINFEFVNTTYKKMLSISTDKIDNSDIYTRSAYYQDEKINTKDPIGNEFLFSPKFNVTKMNKKVDSKVLIATYKSPIFIEYNSTTDVILELTYSFEGYNQDNSGKHSYCDKLEDIKLNGLKNGWIITNGTLHRRNING